MEKRLGRSIPMNLRHELQHMLTMWYFEVTKLQEKKA